MKKGNLYSILTILFTLVTLAVNGLANALPFNGQTTAEISDRFDIFFVPAGYVFSIWGLIYIGLIGFAVYQVLPAQRDDPLIQRIGPAYWLGSLANVVWIFLWHFEFFSLTLVAMLTLLGSLLFIYAQLRKETAGATGARFWALQLPFSIYLGWISVATIANVSQVLYFFDWSGWGIGGSIWAAVMILVAVVLGGVMLWRERDMAYGLVLVWAFAGIAVSQSDTPLVVWSAWLGSGLLVVFGLFVLVGKRALAARP